MDQGINRAAAKQSSRPLCSPPQSAKERATEENFLERADNERGGHRRSNAAAEQGRREIDVPAASVECKGEQSNGGKRNKSEQCTLGKVAASEGRTAHSEVAP